MSTLHITRGLPAAGKTTWARQWVAEDPGARARVNRDDLRVMLFETPDYSWAQEKAVTEASRAAVRALLAADVDVVADDMNLRPKYLREWFRFASANGAEVNVIEFNIDPDEAVTRDAFRERAVGESTIRKMVSKYLQKGHLQPIPDEVFAAEVVEPYLPLPGSIPAVMVDIDGTLALHNGRSPYALNLCGDDLPNAPVVEAVQAAAADDLTVIYCSGREDSTRETTAAWITEHVGIPGLLYMRAADDKRKDSVVKRELFDRHIRDRFDVRYVFDDRQQVVDMWRALGLTVFQVAEGDF